MGLRIAEPEPIELVTTWTAEVDMILSALDVGSNTIRTERRSRDRKTHNAIATLRLYAHAGSPDDPPLLFVRDADERGLGFITQHSLPLGYSGRVSIETPEGELLDVGCTVYRCRHCSGDWYEGALTFSRAQRAFE
jgi:hypothetical protein